ncbi:MAG: chromosomal replication initiator protein DnaA [Oscillospiraceae bacterium]|nr:chromosomal replication initiator protein DnaA [Oscillospiraceae bacterium]
MNSAADIWAKVLSLMERNMTSTTINTWFDDVEAITLNKDQFILASPTEFKRDIIKERYVPYVAGALKELFSADFEVIVIPPEGKSLYTGGAAKSDFLPGTDEYTFERFVVGSSNKFAHAAAQAVADNPGESYNPLFIYGDSGLGKTHLLYAVAHTIHKKFPSFRITYIKGDAFTNELVRAIREGKNQEFREKYRNSDVFLMDDVHFIAGRESTQEEMFHTFNALYERQRQIIFTSDRPPKELLRLEDRLKTRFEWGLLADIKKPEYETRLAIVKNKAIRMGVDLPEPVLSYIAENITENVRQLEGTVKKILALQELMGKKVDINTVIRAVRDMFRDKSDILPSPDLIIQEVAKFYTIDEDAIRGQSRMKETNTARQIAMYIIRNMTNLSLTDIGQEFKRDHTTVLHAINRIDEQAKRDNELSEIIKDIRANVNQRLE